MIVARGLVSVSAGAALVALVALAGCQSVSDSTTYPDRPPTPAPPYFFGVWGSGPDDVYVVGQPGLIYHYDGTSWQRENSPTSVPLTSVWGDPETGRVYVTGHRGVVLRSTGDGVWTAMSTGTSEDLYDVGAFEPLDEARSVLAVGGGGTILRLAGDAWQAAPDQIMVRSNVGAPVDTLTLSLDMVSLTTVFTYGVGGAYVDRRPVDGGVKGCVLLNDLDLDWLLRPIAGGESWVTSAAGGAEVSDNFVGTAAGRLFRMDRLQDGVETFSELYSPSLGEAVYGLWADDQTAVHAVSDAGRVTRVIANTNEPSELYNDGLTFFDVWGTSADNLYAVGIGGRIMHYFDAPGDPIELQWVREDVDLPVTKGLVTVGLDKFGRPL